MRRVTLLLLGLGALLLAACGDDTGTFLPTQLAVPTGPAQSVTIYLLTPSLVPNYKRTSDLTLNAGAIADQKGDPGVTARLVSDGFIHGGRAEYAPPPTVGNPTFNDITSDALIFNDAAGAQAYFKEEAARLNSVPQGGTLDALGGLPRQHVDDVVAYASSAPPIGGAEVDRGFIALMRTGRVVTEVFARGGSAANTNARAFLPLVVAEQTLLAQPPNG